MVAQTTVNMEVNQYTETVKVFHTNYVRNYRAVGVMWGIFTICFALINIVVFIYPQWIGDTRESVGAGYFGLYEHCRIVTGGGLLCYGNFGDFTHILSAAFKGATFFIGFSALLSLVTIVAMLLFFFMSTKIVFFICGVLQLGSTICMFLGCVIYPSGWTNEHVMAVCGNAGAYEIGKCGVRWSYILAILGIFDAMMLCILAIVLATRQAKLKPTGYTSKAYENGYIEKNGHVIQPVMMPHDGYSDYSSPSEPIRNGTTKSKKRNRKDFTL
ncbi:unnamed protein product [Owenia fusiformis]|uniref:Uncharacterized protein n=1 Tax=Owenia fusiformis TaxID=6347 RepID=A0A8S4NRV4_OWEFU|nr:unnamed protein product [Owenia fusiformis]